MKFKSLLAVMAAALCGLARAFNVAPKGVDVSNAAGDFDGGYTRLAEVDIACHLLVTPGTNTATQVKLCTAATEPVGCAFDTSPAGTRIGIERLLDGRTKVMIGSKAIAAGARVYATAGGQVTDAVVTGAFLVGKAIDACAAAGDEFNVQPLSPVVNP